MIIKLIRHGESLANIGHLFPYQVGDSGIGLSDLGKEQSQDVGRALGREFLESALVYCSPYVRTRQTAKYLLLGAGITEPMGMFEDPRLREVERGYMDDVSQHELRKVHGWFYYRHSGGESPADCYDRTSAFLESMMREVQRKPRANVVIVTHGMTIRCFVTRFLHLTVEQFESLDNPDNCDVVTLAPREQLTAPLFVNGRWGVEGMALRAPMPALGATAE